MPSWKCAFRPQNFLSVAILNILTDAGILCVPVPMLWQLKLPLKKKLTIGIILSSGLFVIAAAIIRVVLSLDAAPSAANINGWGVRETFIGIFTINVPILRPLFSSAFWKPGPYDPSALNKGSSNYQKSNNGQSTFKSSKAWKIGKKSSSVTEYELESDVRSPTRDQFPQDDDVSSNSSREKIIPTRSKNYDVEDRVIVETSYDIRSTRRDEEMGSMGGQWSSIGVPK